MNRRQRFVLSRFERHTIAEDPQLDRLLRCGFPTASQRRQYRLAVVVGAVMALASMFVGYSLGVFVGLAALVVGGYQLSQMRKKRTMTGSAEAEKRLHEKGSS